MANETLAAVARATGFLQEWAKAKREAEIAKWQDALCAAKDDAFDGLRRQADNAMREVEKDIGAAYQSFARCIDVVAAFNKGEDQNVLLYPESFSKSDIAWEAQYRRPVTSDKPLWLVRMNGGINWSSTSGTWSVNT